MYVLNCLIETVFSTDMNTLTGKIKNIEFYTERLGLTGPVCRLPKP